MGRARGVAQRVRLGLSELFWVLSRRIPTCYAAPAATSSTTMTATCARSKRYLGHRNIQNTTRYTACPQRFKEFFRD